MNKKEKFYKHLFLEANWGCYGYIYCGSPVRNIGINRSCYATRQCKLHIA